MKTPTESANKEIVLSGFTFRCEDVINGVALNPVLPSNFDDTPNERRPHRHLAWFGVPFVRTYKDDSSEFRKYWKDGIRYDVRCLDGGAWDRSTSLGMFGTLTEAIDLAKERRFIGGSIHTQSHGATVARPGGLVSADSVAADVRASVVPPIEDRDEVRGMRDESGIGHQDQTAPRSAHLHPSSLIPHNSPQSFGAKGPSGDGAVISTTAPSPLIVAPDVRRGMNRGDGKNDHLLTSVATTAIPGRVPFRVETYGNGLACVLDADKMGVIEIGVRGGVVKTLLQAKQIAEVCAAALNQYRKENL